MFSFSKELLLGVVVVASGWLIFTIRVRMVEKRRTTKLSKLKKNYDDAVLIRDIAAIEKAGVLYYRVLGRGAVSDYNRSRIDFDISHSKYLNLHS